MKNYIVNRLLQLIPILLAITLLSFSLIHSTSGDVVDILENNRGTVISQESKAHIRSELNLDKPFIVQYGIWLKNILSGDMGTSYVSHKPVFEAFVNKLPATILLTASSIVLTIIISVPLGIICAVKQNKFIDYLIRFCSFIGNSLPSFFSSLLLIYLFSIKLQLLPVMQNSTINFTGLILPTLTLSIAMSAKYIRQIRAIILEELSKDYVLASKARGISYPTILFHSVFKMSMVTLITLIALSIGSLLGGTAIVESIFMWDGVGKMAVDAITMKDYPMILAYIVWISIIYVIVNLIADILYRYLDPRIRLNSEDN